MKLFAMESPINASCKRETLSTLVRVWYSVLRLVLLTVSATLRCILLLWRFVLNAIRSPQPWPHLSGFHGDLNETYPVGRVDEESLKLMRTARICLDESIKICKPGALFRDIGKIMQALLSPLFVFLHKVNLGALVSLWQGLMDVRLCEHIVDTVSTNYSTVLRMSPITQRIGQSGQWSLEW